jgi:hypothetical protein
MAEEPKTADEITPRTIWEHPERPAQLVVCAAIRRQQDGTVISSARHFDPRMHAMIKLTKEPKSWIRAEQGFIDQFGNFLTRQEAFVIATERNQIRRPDHNHKELYSEHLY